VGRRPAGRNRPADRVADAVHEPAVGRAAR